MNEEIKISVNGVYLKGILNLPEKVSGLVVFSHGSGSGRFSPRNNFVAEVLHKAGIGTLLLDLLTPQEDKIYENRFDIDLLTSRLLSTITWVREQSQTEQLNLGLFGASTGAASALNTAAIVGNKIKAVVSRGGRPDLAQQNLDKVLAPTLLIVGAKDEAVLTLNQQALRKLKTIKKLEIIPEATHLFEEPGRLEEVARLATEWFKQYLI